MDSYWYYDNARHWYEKADAESLNYAQFNLAQMYYLGEGVDKNLAKAVYWYKQAADYGFANAQYNLALSYYNGSGIQKDLEKSEELFLKSCMNDNKKACQNFASGFD